MRCHTIELTVTDLDAGIRPYNGLLGFALQLRDAGHAVWNDARVCLRLTPASSDAPPFIM